MPIVESFGELTGAVAKADIASTLDGPVDLDSGTATTTQIVTALATLGLVNDTA